MCSVLCAVNCVMYIREAQSFHPGIVDRLDTVYFNQRGPPISNGDLYTLVRTQASPALAKDAA